MRIAWIAVGGAAGSVARYLLSSWILSISGPGFPLGTLLVNLIGSFLLGGLMELGLATDLISPTLRVTLAIGVLGGFTTYSSFNYETMQLLERGAWLIAVLNVVTTLLVCLAGGFGGVMLARLAIAVR